MASPSTAVDEARSRSNLIGAAALALILLLAAYLRLTNLTDNPGWFTDEGIHVDIAAHLQEGCWQCMAIGQSTLLLARLPLFDWLLAGLFGLFGGGIGTLRAFTGGLGVLSVLELYVVVRRFAVGQGPWLALLAALMLAVYPQAVLYSRWGFSYNLLAPLLLLVLWGLWEYAAALPREGRAPYGWLALAALAAGLGSVSDLWMFVLFVPFVLFVAVQRWRDLLWSLPLLALPFALYAGVMLLRVPEAFLFDARYTLLRLGALSPLKQVATLALNYTVLLTQDFWMPLGVVGLFLLRPARLQRLSLLLFFVPLVLLGRTVALYNLSFYYNIPLLPLIALGMASTLACAVPHVWRALHAGLQAAARRWRWPWGGLRQGALSAVAGLVLAGIVGTPFVTSAAVTLQQASTGFGTQIDPFLLDAGDARAAAGYVNSRAGADDLVIASPGLAWLLDTRTADFQMSLAAAGQGTAHLPANIPADRFVFDPDYTRARFVVVDDLWRNWAAWDVAGVSSMVERVQTWQLVFRAGSIEVYRNPGGG